jgi:hypothetical protein
MTVEELQQRLEAYGINPFKDDAKMRAKLKLSRHSFL